MWLIHGIPTLHLYLFCQIENNPNVHFLLPSSVALVYSVTGTSASTFCFKQPLKSSLLHGIRNQFFFSFLPLLTDLVAYFDQFKTKERRGIKKKIPVIPLNYSLYISAVPPFSLNVKINVIFFLGSLSLQRTG